VNLERRYTTIGEYRVHSVHAGAGAPVVLLHGLSGSHRWWQHTVAELATHYRVHVPELIGFGRSRPVRKQPDIEATSEILLSWMDELDVRACALVGHSMGAQIAIHFAVRAPERLNRLVLVSAAGIPRALSISEATRFLSEVVPPRAWGSPRFLPTIALDALRAGPRTILRAALYLFADDVRPLLPLIRTPTLLIWGGRDPLTPIDHAREMLRLIPGARLITLPKAAHVPMADRPVEFNAALTEFLAEQTG
jgi:pimeloyl-ACP methyl ester carboxylesterase